MRTGGLTIAVLGLGFGADFVPIYLSHPAVDRVVLVEPDERRRSSVADRFGIDAGYADLDQVLVDPSVDAVHVLAPVHFHADYACRVLEAGKHCASAVPMATSLADLARVIEAEDRSGKRYQMMETALYGREYLATAELLAAGAFGSLTFYRGYHVQNLDGFPTYWQGFPPMHYLTHAQSPALGLLDTRVSSVRAIGTGTLTPERRTGGFDNPFPTEVGFFELEGSDVVAEVQMSFAQTARSYVEGFSLYGDRLGLEWPVDHVGPMIKYAMSGPAEGSRGNTVQAETFEPRDFGELLPEELAGFVRPGQVDLPGMPAPVSLSAAHSGSHPFLVHEFLQAIIDDRPSAIDARRAAELTAPGICAHQSALQGGERVEVPAFRSLPEHD
jgi:predicted dehydrogenase